MKRSIKIFTAIALTIGVASGAAAFGKHRFGDPAKRAAHVVSYISDELNLDTTQEQALTLLKDEVITIGSLLHEQMEPFRTDMEALIAADGFDQGRALELVTTKTATINEAAPTMIAALGNFLDTLDSEQKAEVINFMEHREGRRFHGRNHD